MRISIAIPTRERAETLKYTLATCVRLKQDVEIVVSDNASHDATRDVAHAFNDPRIRYCRTPRRISQRLNFENAISEATGDYVLTMGDDDGILTHSFDYVLALLKSERPDALSLPSVYYRWPSQKDPSSGRLKLKKGGLFGKLSSIEAAAYRAALERVSFSREDVSPKVYHGFASRALLERMKARTGWYIASGQIDMYFATASLACMQRYLHLSHPVSVLGMGPKSGGLSVTEQHRKDGTSNQTAEVVVDEAAIDPVRDVIEGSMPVLLMYLLNGVEQANRFAFDGSLRLDYAEYMRRIAEQLVSVPAEAQVLGRRQLKGFLDSVGRSELVAVIDDALSAAAGKNEKKPKSIRSLANYITPSKIAIDLHPYGHGNVLAAAQAVDHLVGPITQAMPAKFAGWARTLGRAVQHLARAKLGMRPDWGRLP